MWAQLKQWWATEGAVVQLRGLDNRLLADMGLEREGLRKRVRGEGDGPGVGTATVGASVCEGC